VRFELFEFVSIDESAVYAVLLAPFVERLQAREFVVGGRDDDFATAVEGERMGRAESFELCFTRPAGEGFFRAGGVVDAGVNHAGVVAGLVASGAGFFIDDKEACLGKLVGKLISGREADDTGTDDEGVWGLHGWGT